MLAVETSFGQLGIRQIGFQGDRHAILSVQNNLGITSARIGGPGAREALPELCPSLHIGGNVSVSYI